LDVSGCPAVAKDLPGHPGKDVLDPSLDLLVRAVVVLLPLTQFAAGGAEARDHEFGALVAAVGDRRGPSYGLLCPDSARALRSLRFPGTGGPTKWVSASMTIWWFVEWRISSTVRRRCDHGSGEVCGVDSSR
jgi:hypothetical protein